MLKLSAFCRSAVVRVTALTSRHSSAVARVGSWGKGMPAVHSARAKAHEKGRSNNIADLRLPIADSELCNWQLEIGNWQWRDSCRPIKISFRSSRHATWSKLLTGHSRK